MHSPTCQHYNLDLEDADTKKTCWCLGKWLEDVQVDKASGVDKKRADSLILEEVAM